MAESLAHSVVARPLSSLLANSYGSNCNQNGTSCDDTHSSNGNPKFFSVGQGSAPPCRVCLESADVELGECRVLRQQLLVSEAARKALYEEKCELEEAENDARLMVQR